MSQRPIRPGWPYSNTPRLRCTAPTRTLNGAPYHINFQTIDSSPKSSQKFYKHVRETASVISACNRQGTRHIVHQERSRPNPGVGLPP